MKKLRILIVDSDLVFASNVCRTLAEARETEVIGIEHDGIKGLECIERMRPDVVLMDIQLPGMDGISVLKETRLMREPPVVIICTHFYSEFCVVSAQQNGAAYILYKPIEYHSLPALIWDCYKSFHSDQQRQKRQAEEREIKISDAYRIKTILFEMGMSPRFVGCMYLIESILIADKNRMLLGNLSKGLYSEIAVKLNTSPACVERSLRSAISATYERGSLSKIFDHRPTNKQFLMYLIRKMNENDAMTNIH